MKRFKFTPEHSEVQVQKKNHFTVTPIANIETWRAEREQIEAEYHKGMMERLGAAKARARAGVEGQDRTLTLNTLEQAEVAYVKSREEAKKPAKITWEQIKAKMDNWDAKNEQARASKLGFAPGERAPRDTPVSPKPSLFERAKRSIARFIRGAFPQ